MRFNRLFFKFLIAGIDFVSAIILCLYALLVGPLGFLRGPIVFTRTFGYLWGLSSHNLLTKAIGIALDWRLGNFSIAITQAEGLINILEEDLKVKKYRMSSRKKVLEDFYIILTRAYLHTGHIDEAMQVVIRACKLLNIDRLTGLNGLDAKTAQLVRASLAAGKMLEGNGLATMFIKAQDSKENKKVSSSKKNIPPTVKKKGAIILPFPRLND